MKTCTFTQRLTANQPLTSSADKPMKDDSMRSGFNRRFRPRIGMLALSVIASVCVLATPDAWAKKTGAPYYSLTGETKDNLDYKWHLIFKDSNGIKRVVEKGIMARMGTDDLTLAKNIAAELNNDKDINDEYEFKVGEDKDNRKLILVWGFRKLPLPGKKPHVEDIYLSGVTTQNVGVRLPKKPTGLMLGTAIDPVVGTAEWNITGFAGSEDSGTVTIGIGGVRVSALTSDADGDKSVDTIKTELVNGLINAGYSDAYIDLQTGLIVAPNVPTGDASYADLGSTPQTGDSDANRDIGALFLSTDSDISGSTAIRVDTDNLY